MNLLCSPLSSLLVVFPSPTSQWSVRLCLILKFGRHLCLDIASKRHQEPGVEKREKKRQLQPDIKEYFLGYIDVEQTTGLNLSSVVRDKLKELGIPFENCRGQAYDNGTNMTEKKQGLQARLLQSNPRALFVACGAHTMNRVIADSAKSSQDATGYFGYLQNLFNFFSGATQRWAILTKH
ncbi:hypothetical protein SRHO_G00130560 [Serrasalmus rhombeus]